jgi:hypothetical protein
MTRRESLIRKTMGLREGDWPRRPHDENAACTPQRHCKKLGTTPWLVRVDLELVLRDGARAEAESGPGKAARLRKATTVRPGIPARQPGEVKPDSPERSKPVRQKALDPKPRPDPRSVNPNHRKPKPTSSNVPFYRRASCPTRPSDGLEGPGCCGQPHQCMMMGYMDC